MEKVLLFLFISIYCIIESKNFSKRKTQSQKEYINNRYILVVCFSFAMVASLRHLTVGSDTINYYMWFQTIESMSWSSIVTEFSNYYVRDVGYVIINKLLSSLGLPFRALIVIVDFTFYYGLYHLLKHNTRDVIQSYVALLFILLLFLGFTYTGLRQVLVFGLCLYSVEFIKRERILLFMMIVLLGSLFHKSALIFLPFYFISKIKESQIVLLFVIAIFPIIFSFSSQIAAFLGSVSRDLQYYKYSSGYKDAGAPIFTAFLLAVSVFYIFTKKQLEIFFQFNYLFGNSLMIAVALVPIAWVNPTLLRVPMYYYLSTPLLVSMIFYSQKKAIKDFLIVFISIIVLIQLYISDSGNFAFMWEDVRMTNSIGDRIIEEF